MYFHQIYFRLGKDNGVNIEKPGLEQEPKLVSMINFNFSIQVH